MGGFCNGDGLGANRVLVLRWFMALDGMGVGNVEYRRSRGFGDRRSERVYGWDGSAVGV